MHVVLAMRREPAMRFLGVGFDTHPGLVHEPDLELRNLVALLGGDLVPAHGRRVIQYDAVTKLVDHRQIVGGVSVAFFRPGFPDGDGLGGVAALVQFRRLAQFVIDIPGVGGKAGCGEHQGKRQQGKETVHGQSNRQGLERREC